MLSKRRLYSVRERDAGNVKLTVRWKRNSPRFIRALKKLVTPVDELVLRCFEKEGIDIKSLQRPQPYWWDIEALRRFRLNGYRVYQWDDIWNYQWEEALEKAKSLCLDNLPDRVKRPGIFISSFRYLIISGYYLIVVLYRKLLSTADSILKCKRAAEGDLGACENTSHVGKLSVDENKQRPQR